jgi:hypothetical protein
MVFQCGGSNLEMVRVRWIHVGVTWPSTNKFPKNFKEIYPLVLGSVLRMETMFGELWTRIMW